MAFDRTTGMLAARAHLLADPRFSKFLGTDVGTDLSHGAAYPDQLWQDGWVFPGLTSDGRPLRDPSGTGTSAVTLDLYGAPWSASNLHNTLTFPVLRIIVWSDPTRPTDANDLIAVQDAEARCMRVRGAIEDVFHDVGHQIRWPVPIASCLLGSELPIRDISPYDGMVAGEVRFHLEAV